MLLKTLIATKFGSRYEAKVVSLQEASKLNRIGLLKAK